MTDDNYSTDEYLSVDYEYGLQTKCYKYSFDMWVEVDKFVHFPESLDSIIDRPYVNCEFINGELVNHHSTTIYDYHK